MGHGLDPPVHLGHGYDPPVHLGHGYDPPVHLGHGYNPPVHLGHGYDPPVHLGHGYDPSVQLGYGQDPPYHPSHLIQPDPPEHDTNNVKFHTQEDQMFSKCQAKEATIVFHMSTISMLACSRFSAKIQRTRSSKLALH